MRIVTDCEINEAVLKDISEILSDYTIVISKKIKSDIKNPKKEFLKDSNEKKCRFCKKSYPQVKFDKDAHAIPNFIGNQSLFHKNECDSCNALFSKYENELANFMLPLNSIYGIKGKKGTPKYKLKGEPIIKSEGENQIEITEAPNSILKQNESIDLNLKIPSYIPDYIYRCLIKIGLSLIPESKIVEYERIFNWLISSSQKSQISQYAIMSIYPSNFRMDEITCIILEKKNSCLDKYTESILSISYSNFAFQTYFPSKFTVEKELKLTGFPYAIPTPLDINKSVSREFKLINLNSEVRSVNESVELEIQNMDLK